MAADWIKIEDTLPDKPEVVQMAAILDIDQDAVTGKLLRVWIWADHNSVDGNAIPVTSAFLDRLVCHPGFADAMRKVGWLEGRDSALTFPRFDRHNGQTAKARAETNRRVAAHRAKAKEPHPVPECNAKSVTSALQKPLPEKRREEKSKKSTHTAREGIEGHRPPPSLATVLAHASTAGIPPEVAEKFFHEAEARTFAASGMWTDIRGNEMGNWQSALQAYWLGWQNRNHGKHENRNEIDRDRHRTGIKTTAGAGLKSL